MKSYLDLVPISAKSTSKAKSYVYYLYCIGCLSGNSYFRYG